MKLEALVASADSLSTINADALAEYEAKRELLVSRIDQEMLARPDIEALVGADNLQMMKDNHANHALFLAALMGNFDPRVLVDTVMWVFRTYRSRNFHPNYWAAQLNAWVEAIKQELSADGASAILPFYHWMIVHIPQFTDLSDAAACEENE